MQKKDRKDRNMKYTEYGNKNAWNGWDIHHRYGDTTNNVDSS